MAAEIKRACDHEPTLIAGGGGIFEVTVDDRIIFSKAKTGRFPETGEIAGML